MASVPVGTRLCFSLGWEMAPRRCSVGTPLATAAAQLPEEAASSQGLGLRSIPISLIPILLAGALSPVPEGREFCRSGSGGTPTAGAGEPQCLGGL